MGRSLIPGAPVLNLLRSLQLFRRMPHLCERTEGPRRRRAPGSNTLPQPEKPESPYPKGQDNDRASTQRLTVAVCVTGGEDPVTTLRDATSAPGSRGFARAACDPRLCRERAGPGAA